MRVKKFIMIFILATLFFVNPNKVQAEDINYGGCITMFGKMNLENIGGPANTMRDSLFPIVITDTKSNLVRSTNPESYNIHLKAPTYDSVNKIKSITYSISYAGEKSCESSILGKDIEANNGYIELHVELNKGFIDSMRWEVEAINTNTGEKKNYDRNINIRLGDPNTPPENVVAGTTGTNTTAKAGETTTTTTKASEMKDVCDKNFREKFLHKYWRWIMFLTPILLIVMITIDFIKAMANNDADAIKKSSTDAIKRVIAGVILLALPMLLKIIFGWFGMEFCF